MDDAEVKAWRRRLPKNWTRQPIAQVRSVGPGWEPVEADGDTVKVEAPRFYGPGNTAPARQVAEDVYGMVWKWAQSNPQAYQLAVHLMRRHNPAAFGHLSNEQLQAKLEEHAKAAAREATETTYRANRWDRGNDLTPGR